MYNGGFGNQPGFSIQNYAPVDPMAGIPGFQAPAPVQPPQLQHQAPGPSASSSAGAPVRTSQSTSGTASALAKDVRGTRHYSTEEMRRDLDNSMPYIPTPINNPPVGVGSLESQRRQAAPQQQVSGHPAASADSQRRTNQQPQQYDARIDIRALHMMPNQNHQVTPVRPQHPGQGIPDPRMLPPMPAQVLTQTILANMARLPMPPVQVNAPLPPTLPAQHAQRPPILLPLPPEGTTRVQEYPDICVFNEGHPRYSTDLLMNSHMFKIVDFVSYAMNTGIQLSQRTCHLIRERLPPSRRDILPATGLQGPPAAPNVVPSQDNRVLPPGPNVQPSRPPIPNVANLSVPPLPVPPQLRAPNQHLIPQHPPPGILMAPPNAHQVQPGNMNPAATQEQILQWNRQQQFHQLQQRQHQLIQEQQQLQQQHQQRQQQQQQNLQRQQQQQQQQFQQQNLQLQQQQLQQQQQQRTQGPPATQQSQNLPSHFPQSVLDQQRIAPQQQPPAPHQIQNHQQQHQQHMQQHQQHQQFQQHQILHQMQHQQHQLHLQRQQCAELQQQQRQVQQKQGSSSNPQPTEPSLPPTSNAVFSSSDTQSSVADAPHFIAADDAAPPCAYSPTSSPPLTASPEETVEVKPTIPVREKPPKKKRIEVVTLDDDPPARIKQEPVEEVSSTSDAQRKGVSPVRNTNIKQEEDNTVPDAPTNEPNQQPNNPARSAVSVKPEPVEEARPSAVAQKPNTEAQASHPRPEVTQEEVDRRAMLLLKEWKKTICEKNPELAKLLEENPELANVEDFDCKSVQESIVSTSLPAISNLVRSRSSSEGSDDIITLRKKKKVDDVKEEESDDNEDISDGSPQPSTSAGPSRINDAPKNQNSRPEKRNVTFEESDDDMLLIQKKKKRNNRRSSEESEEWRDDGRHTVSSEEEEEEVEEEEDWEDSRFVVDDDEDSEVEEDEIDDEGNLADFVVEDDFIEMEEDSSDEERRRYTREKKESRRSSKQATKRRTPVRESAKRHSPKPSERAGNVRKSKSTEERRRRYTEDTPPPSAPPMSEERRKMLKRQERMHKAEERRLGKQLEKKARLSEAHALKDQKFNNLHRERKEQRKEVPAPLNKRTTSTVSSDNDDGDGVHVPAKRMAHANSVPGPSRDRPMSSQPVRRNHPNQNDLEGRRYAEADEKKKKLQEEYAKLKAKKYPTGGEEQRIKELQKLLKVSRPLPPTPSSLASSSTVKKVTIKQEIRSPVKKAPMLPPAPKYLDPTKGRAFLNTRKQVIEKIYKDLVNGERANPETEAQRIELELATANPNDEKKYINSCATRRMQLQRESTSGIIEVNKNAVSHDKILSGAPKENCLVAKGRKVHVDHRTMTMEQLQPFLIPFKMTNAELETNAYPMFREGSRTASIAETTYTLNKKMFLDDFDMKRTCSRCQKEFKLRPDGTMVREKDICRYHHRGTNRNGKRDTFQKRYTCCNEEYNSTPGCKFSDVHVFDQLFKKELATFYATPRPTSTNDPRSNKAYALDCEMVYTVAGPALARLTMVDMYKNMVLDLFIKPPTEVLDPNTEFSGLTMETINNAKDTMASCHQKLFKFVNSETILIGHSLESDLKAMRIVHTNVIDTAILFRSSGDFKVALKNLSAKLLHKNIQGDNEDAVGHDSLEDAGTCVDLIFYGLKNPESVVIRK